MCVSRLCRGSLASLSPSVSPSPSLSLSLALSPSLSLSLSLSLLSLSLSLSLPPSLPPSLSVSLSLPPAFQVFTFFPCRAHWPLLFDRKCVFLGLRTPTDPLSDASSLGGSWSSRPLNSEQTRTRADSGPGDTFHLLHKLFKHAHFYFSVI